MPRPGVDSLVRRWSRRHSESRCLHWCIARSAALSPRASIFAPKAIAWSPPALSLGAQSHVHLDLHHSYFVLSSLGELAIALKWLAGYMALMISSVPGEETLMEQQFGDEYEAWAARTGRFVPRIRKE